MAIATIEHMSREVISLSSAALAFRTRTAFTVWLGPYVILGAIVIATKGSFSLPDLTSVRMHLLSGSVVFVALGVLAGYIERHYWKQANMIRDAIAELAGSFDVPNPLVRDALKDVEQQRQVVLGYVVVFVLILFSLWVVAILASRILPVVVTGSAG